MSEWDWPGARWWKVDFHTHTPASDDYGKGKHQAELKKTTPREWLLDFMRAEIDCVAVTDHNTGAWIDPLKTALEELQQERPEGYRDLVLFPGVEISCSGGVHVLALFGPSRSTADVEHLLGAVKYQGAPGCSDGVTSLSCEQAFREIADAGALGIPAHVDQECGLFKLSGETLRQVLGEAKESGVVAIEVVEGAYERPALYGELKLNWSEVLGSDSHHSSQKYSKKYPGSRYTWVKMGPPTLEGLRLALLDGAVRVVREPETDIDSPNEYNHSVIEALQVHDARYMGRGEALELRFNPWLNAIIGGRGTGKSTTVEFLRLALRRQEELPKALEEDFKKYSKISAGRRDTGLVINSTRLEVFYRKDGQRFRIQWAAAGDPPTAIQVETDSGWRDEDGEIATRFPVRIYSQKQIFELAQSPYALLQQVDQATEVGKIEWQQAMQAEQSQYFDLCRQERDLQTKLQEEVRLRGELQDVEHKLRIFESAGHTEILRRLQQARQQTTRIEAWEDEWREHGAALRNLAESLLPTDLAAELQQTSNFDDAQLLDAAGDVSDRFQSLHERLLRLAQHADAVWQSWLERKRGSTWQATTESAERAYADLAARLREEAVEDPAGYSALMQRQLVLQRRLENLQRDREQLETISKEKKQRLKRLQELRRDLTQRRSRFLEDVLNENPYVRIDVLAYSDKEAVEAELREMLDLQDGRFEKDVEAISSVLHPESEESEPEAEELESRLQQMKCELRDVRVGEKLPQRDLRFKSHLERLSPERLERLDTWFPEDFLDVRYVPEPKGARTLKDSDFQPLQAGSPGQKTAALLAFLLQLGEEPMVLDQPEDDLDNRLIYDLIVTQLRTLKLRRQVIVVTHNANIVVNGDAELVTVLTAGGGKTWCNSQGSLQNSVVRQDVCKILEGGKEALEERYRRILHPEN